MFSQVICFLKYVAENNRNLQNRNLSNLTIIIVTKDNADDLRQTLLSVNELDEAEIIIVNGSSAPISLGDKHAKRAKLKIIEGPDSGIYHGMNRGLENVTTRFVWFLNSGDVFLKNFDLDKALERMLKKNVDLLMCLQEPSSILKAFTMSFSRTLLFSGVAPIPHQSAIFSTEKLVGLNGFDTSYKVEADQELFIRLFLNKSKFEYFSEPLSFHKYGGVGDLQEYGIFKTQVHNILINLNYTWTRREAWMRDCLLMLVSLKRSISNGK